MLQVVCLANDQVDTLADLGYAARVGDSASEKESLDCADLSGFFMDS